MTETLVLQLPPGDAPDAPVRWTLIRSGAVLADGEFSDGTGPDLPPGAAPDRALALMPAEDVFVRRLAAPGRSERDARRAAPFLIEDHLAQPVDQLSVALGPADADGQRWLFAADKALAGRWAKLAAQTGVRPLWALPDALALPVQGADLALSVIDGRLVFRAAALGGEHEAELALNRPLSGAVTETLAEPVLRGLMQRLAPRTVRLDPEFDLAWLSDAGVEFRADRVRPDDIRLLAARLTPDTLSAWPSLLGERFGASLDWASILKPWRLAAGLAVAACLSASVAAAMQASYLEMRTRAYLTAERAAFQQVFPDTPIVRLRAQLNQALAGVGGGTDTAGFLTLASALGAVMDGQDQIQIEALRYDAERGALSVTARYGGFDDFEALRAAAEARGLVLEDGGARQGAQGVVGDFTVRLP